MSFERRNGRDRRHRGHRPGLERLRHNAAVRWRRHLASGARCEADRCRDLRQRRLRERGGQFPASNPTFRLVSLTKKTAKIAIAGGSLEGGSQTVTLKKNVPLTLMNTADGTRYVLRLLSVGSAGPTPPPDSP